MPGELDLRATGAVIDALGSGGFARALLAFVAPRLGAERCEATLWVGANEARLLFVEGSPADGIPDWDPHAAWALGELRRGAPVVARVGDSSGERRGTGVEVLSLWRACAGGALRLRLWSLAATVGGDRGGAAWRRPVAELAARLVVKHVEMTTDGGATTAGPGERNATSAELDHMGAQVLRALLATPVGLTRREAEVCAAIVIGCTTRAIGYRLGITANTVATHRKRAYAKLGISCQNELFARYVAAATRSPVERPRAPSLAVATGARDFLPAAAARH